MVRVSGVSGEEAPGRLAVVGDELGHVEPDDPAVEHAPVAADHDAVGALGWATAGSARALGRADVGILAPGKQADLAMFTLDELRFSGSHDPVAALLLCGAERADRVMVGGRWRVLDGQIVGLDVPQLIAHHSEAARSLLARHS